MIYGMLKNLIKNDRFELEDMNNKLDAFMLFNRITLEQYSELQGLINPIISD